MIESRRYLLRRVGRYWHKQTYRSVCYLSAFRGRSRHKPRGIVPMISAAFDPRKIFSEPSALSEAFRPPFGMPEGDGDASGYHGRDRRLRPLRWEVGGMREYVTDKCCNRADRRLSSGAIDCPVHLGKKGNRNGRTDNAANRGEECVLETERGENISARHYEKAGEPSSSELFSNGARKPTRAQIIKCVEDTELEASHR